MFSERNGGPRLKAHQLKVTIVLTGLIRAGAGNLVINTITRLKARGWDIGVISMLPPQDFIETLDRAGIPAAYLNMRRGVADPRAILKAGAILRQWKPHILHSHTIHANLFARAVRPFARVPLVICTAHSINEGEGLWEFAYRISDPFCDLTTNVSLAAANRYIERGMVPEHKMKMIPNGIVTDRFRFNLEARNRLRRKLGIDDRFVWLAVGRLEEAKDYPDMLQAMVKIQHHQENPLLLVVGEGSLESTVKTLARSLNIDTSVRFLGFRLDIPDLLSASDAYVMSSAWEGMPLVLLEASSAGLPIVATDVGGNREVVLDEESGLLVKPRAPDALAQAMLRMMDLSPEARQQMGAMGGRHVEATYNIEHIVDLWEELYLTLLAEKKPRILA